MLPSINKHGHKIYHNLEQLEQIQVLLENAAEISGLSGELVQGGLNIQVKVRSKVSGHRVPTGFTSERQMWIHLEISDASGYTFFQTGALDQNGDLYDNHSEFVKDGTYYPDEHLVNFQSRPTMGTRWLLFCNPSLDAPPTAEFRAGGTHLWVLSFLETDVAVEHFL